MIKKGKVFTGVFLFVWMLACPSWSALQQDLPYYNEITQVINSMEYSAFEIITKPEVSLSIDFDKKSWTMHNVRQYDAQGGILLEQGRYGLCAELATYAYQKLQPILKNQYHITFASATEKSFFPSYESNHIVLLMRDMSQQKTYLIDPSFHKYGNIKDLNEYQIFGVQEALSFVKDKSPDVSFLVDQAMPLFVKDDLLLSFSVTSVDEKFDKDNFLFVVSANHRNVPTGFNIIIVGKHKGEVKYFEGRDVLDKIVEPQGIDKLHKKLDDWIFQH